MNRGESKIEDVVYKSPCGPLLLSFSPKGLRKVSFKTKENSAKKTSLPFPKATQILKWFDAYFKGTTSVFPWEWLDVEGTDFQKKVWKVLWKIPSGEAKSYRWVAEKAGVKKGYRAVGGANNKNPLPIVIPCHRVIAADGSLGGYAGGLGMKKKLLQHEGFVGAIHGDEK